MKKHRISAFTGLLVLVLLALPAPALAAGGEGWGWWATAGRWVNLLLVVVPLVIWLRKPLGQYFAGRRQAIRNEIEEAAEARRQAEEKLAEVEQKMKALDEEVENIRQQARQEAAAERRRLLQEARADGERIVAAAEREIGNLKRQARAELKDYASQLALEMAEERIRESMTEKDEAELADRFFVRLAQTRTPGDAN
ncbi:MAG TPA: ATP synthase F0 subunit B [Acidobacteriota bacterium]|nr:ATP synthase F0 subunit B [Acidobacteriota bacterium]